MPQESDIKHIRQVADEADLLHNRTNVAQALDAMAARITERLSDAVPLVLCVMNGGLIPTGLLLDRLPFPLQLDYVHATRYQGETTGAELQWLKKPTLSLEGRTVLLVDDILDEGVTLQTLRDWCLEQNPKEVLSAVLVEKRHNRKQTPIEADFVGLTVPDRYVFGYGMDYKNHLRNAPGIYAVKGL